MSGLIGTIGEKPIHFDGDYFFQNTAMSATGTLTSGELTLNNTLGSLQLTGSVSGAVADTSKVTPTLQYKDSAGAWQTAAVITPVAAAVAAGGGILFRFIPVPSNDKRIYRLTVVTAGASATNLTVAIEYLPR